MQALIFSKDRPMQLDACIGSMLHYGQMEQKDIVVQLKYCPEYNITIKKYPSVKWVKEDDFHNTLADIVNNKLTENVLMCVDDAVFFREFNTKFIDTLINTSQHIIGFSLRLGKNIIGATGSPATDIDTWQWKSAASHHGYPFDLSASIYRSSLLKQIVNANSRYRLPNDLEGCGQRSCVRDHSDTYLCSYVKSCAACQDINRVQNIAPNRIQGTAEHTPLKLKNKYVDGWRIDWSVLKHIEPTDCFIGYEHLKLRKDEKK